MVILIDYGLGNIKSVQRALEKAGAEVKISRKGSGIRNADTLVVPGVGAFRKAMENLSSLNLLEPLREYLSEGRPYLGICLGMQILFEESMEYGRTPGLGIIPGRVLRFPEGVKIPHMGWNRVFSEYRHSMFEGISEGAFFYFDHPYYVKPARDEDTAGVTGYGIRVASSVASGDIWGVQFHPEKSSSDGIALLKNFLQMSENG